MEKTQNTLTIADLFFRVVVSAVIFFAVTMPFREFFSVMEVTEVRPASALPPVLGLIWGIPGALGCAVGNMAADFLSGYDPLLCVIAFPMQFLYGIFPFLIWKIIRRYDSEEDAFFRLKNVKNVIRYIAIVLLDAVLIAAMLGLLMQKFGISRFFSTGTLMLLLNNFVFCMVLGIPIIIFTTMKRLKSRHAGISLNERFVLIFLLLGVILAAMIGVFAYIELSGNIIDPLAMWNHIYFFIVVEQVIFYIITIAFLWYSEKNIIIPIESIAKIAKEYINSGKKHSGGSDIAARCEGFSKNLNETGTLAIAFREMVLDLDSYMERLQRQLVRIKRLNESTIRFVPLQFMEHLGVSDISKMKLGDNVQREITVLFFDIRAFSINSEMMTARENFLFINKILGITGPIIRKHNGFVDKYIGDAAMALFDNGLDAVRAGIELYRKLIFDRNTKVRIGVDGINIGVGIHTGSVMMGIVGENERLSSTVISANVNLASRVESLSKQTGSGLLITRDTLNQLAGSESEFAYRFIGMVQAAGVNEVVGLFDMLDALPDRDRRFRIATKELFESGVRKFHTKNFAAAVKRFEKVVAADPHDICAAHHLSEARKHLEKPGLPSVFIFDKK